MISQTSFPMGSFTVCGWDVAITQYVHTERRQINTPYPPPKYFTCCNFNLPFRPPVGARNPCFALSPRRIVSAAKWFPRVAWLSQSSRSESDKSRVRQLKGYDIIVAMDFMTFLLQGHLNCKISFHILSSVRQNSSLIKHLFYRPLPMNWFVVVYFKFCWLFQLIIDSFVHDNYYLSLEITTCCRYLLLLCAKFLLHFFFLFLQLLDLFLHDFISVHISQQL